MSARIGELYRTAGGYTQREVDRAARTLLADFRGAWERRFGPDGVPKVALEVAHAPNSRGASREDHRRPIDPLTPDLVLTLSTPRPAEARITKRFGVLVPRDCGAHGEVEIDGHSGVVEFRARVADLLPQMKEPLALRLEIAVEALASDALKELAEAAERGLRSKGY